MKAIRERPIKSDVPLKIFWADEEDLDNKLASVPTHVEYTTKEKVEIPCFRLLDANLAPAIPSLVDVRDGEGVVTGTDRPYISYSVPQRTAEVDWLEREYDEDSEDEAFLASLAEKMFVGEGQQGFVLTEDLFEGIMDFLEKQSFDEREFAQVIIEQPKVQFDSEDVPCCACMRRESTEENPIIFCDSCDIAIHLECQGLDYLPPEEWYCDRCVYQHKHENAEIICCQCGQSGSALKRTSDKRWIHITCAMWIPELDDRGQVVEMSPLLKRRSTLRCDICHKPGGCVQCSSRKCCVPYHATCAQLSVQLMTVQEPEDVDQPKIYLSYCKKHTQAIEQARVKEAIKQNPLRVELGKFVDLVYTPALVSKRLGTSIHPEAFGLVANYWKEKRYKINHGRSPLIRRLLIETEEEKKRQNLIDTGNSVVVNILPGTKEMKLETLRNVRFDIERARAITEVILSREREKCLLLQLYASFLRPMKLRFKIPLETRETHPDIFIDLPSVVEEMEVAEVDANVATDTKPNVIFIKDTLSKLVATENALSMLMPRVFTPYATQTTTTMAIDVEATGTEEDKKDALETDIGEKQEAEEKSFARKENDEEAQMILDYGEKAVPEIIDYIKKEGPDIINDGEKEVQVTEPETIAVAPELVHSDTPTPGVTSPPKSLKFPLPSTPAKWHKEMESGVLKIVSNPLYIEYLKEKKRPIKPSGREKRGDRDRKPKRLNPEKDSEFRESKRRTSQTKRKRESETEREEELKTPTKKLRTSSSMTPTAKFTPSKKPPRRSSRIGSELVVRIPRSIFVEVGILPPLLEPDTQKPEKKVARSPGKKETKVTQKLEQKRTKDIKNTENAKDTKTAVKPKTKASLEKKVSKPFAPPQRTPKKSPAEDEKINKTNSDKSEKSKTSKTERIKSEKSESKTSKSEQSKNKSERSEKSKSRQREKRDNTGNKKSESSKNETNKKSKNDVSPKKSPSKGSEPSPQKEVSVIERLLSEQIKRVTKRDERDIRSEKRRLEREEREKRRKARMRPADEAGRGPAVKRKREEDKTDGRSTKIQKNTAGDVGNRQERKDDKAVDAGSDSEGIDMGAEAMSRSEGQPAKKVRVPEADKSEEDGDVAVILAKITGKKPRKPDFKKEKSSNAIGWCPQWHDEGRSHDFQDSSSSSSPSSSSPSSSSSSSSSSDSSDPRLSSVPAKKTRIVRKINTTNKTTTGAKTKTNNTNTTPKRKRPLTKRPAVVVDSSSSASSSPRFAKPAQLPTKKRTRTVR